MRQLRTLAALLAALPLLAGCLGDPTGKGSLDVEAAGRLERGSVVTLTVRRDGEVLDPSRVTLAFSPADAAQADPAGGYRLLRAGDVEVTAAAPGLRGRVVLDVAAPPTVVFDLLQGGNRDIWRVDLDGANLQRLTEDPGEDQDPTAAAGKVVFVSYRNGQAELYSVPLAGGASQRLTTTAYGELSPSLRPDGQMLAYTADPTGVAKLYTANADGTGQARATANFGFSGSIEASPEWAPTGNRLAFVATSGPGGTADLYDLALPGTPAFLYGKASRAEVEPVWNAAGTIMAYTSDDAPNEDTEVFMVRLSDAQVTRLSNRPGLDSSPAWTADGRIVYVQATGNASRLVWIDPASPAAIHPIETGPGAAMRPVVAR